MKWFTLLENISAFSLRTLFRYIAANNKGIYVMNRDWDFLIILDACRYDTFKKLNFIPGRLYKVKSLAADTSEWIEKNFSKTYSDTIYISANPWVSIMMLKRKFGRCPFYKVIEVWKFGWDEKLCTVPPIQVNKAVLLALRRYKNKRMIIHYMQPHFPPLRGRFRGTGVKRTRYQIAHEQNVVMKDKTIWDYIREGKLGIAEVKRLYEENLMMVLKYVERLFKKLNGKIIITSDHGNCFGEWYLLAHPRGIYIKQLIEIPWLEVYI